DGFWRRRFGADASVLGRTINLSGVPHTVIGVMKPDFQYPTREHQIWTPLTNPVAPGNNQLAVARLKPGVSIEQARSEMDVIARRLAAPVYGFPRSAERMFASSSETGVAVVPLHDDTVGAVCPALLVIFCAVSCLLL